MDLEASAEALGGGTPVAEPIKEERRGDLREQLSEIWKKGQDDQTSGGETVEAVDDVQPVEKPSEPKPVERQVEAPSDLPKGIKDNWGNLTPEVREAVQASHRELSDKLREQGRQVQAIAPIRDELVATIKEIPEFANLKPDQVLKNIRNFRQQVLAPLAKDPVNTLLRQAQQRGVADQLREALGGQPAQGGAQLQQAMQTIKQLQAQVEQLSDPSTWEERVTQVTQTTSVKSEVQQFASQAEHWDSVEAHMPQMIQIMRAKLGESASAKDVLSAAYDQAVSLFVPQAEAPETPAEAVQAVDPEKAKAAIKAKSTNVTGQPTGKQRELSPREVARKAYRRLQDK